MLYTESSSPNSRGEALADEIMAVFDLKGPQMAGEYAPDRTFRPVERELGHLIIEKSYQWESSGGIANHDQIAGDILHETAAGQSYLYRVKKNPSGLGASNDDPNGRGITFDHIGKGIEATVAHWLNYSVGEGAWSKFDPRYQAMKDEETRRRSRPNEYPGDSWRMFGVVKELKMFGGRWAVPGVGYGAAIAQLANLIRTYLDLPPLVSGQDRRFLWLPDTTEFGYPKGVRGRSGLSILWGIVHITAGTDSSGWLRGGNGSSTHYLTWPDMTPREQHVSEYDAAWTAGHRRWNERGLNVEAERANYLVPWTSAQIKNFAVTTYPIWKRNNIPLRYVGKTDAPGLLGHSDVPDPDGSGWGGTGNHADPGSGFNWDQYLYELLRLDAQIPSPPTRPTVISFAEVPYVIGGGFRSFYEMLENTEVVGSNTGAQIITLGYPRSNEFDAPIPSKNGALRTVQAFDRGALLYQPEDPRPYDVVKPLGQDYFAIIESGYKQGKITRENALLLLGPRLLQFVEQG